MAIRARLRSIRGMRSIGHCLGARVVAEGVDTFEQERVLRDQGCDELQGFLLAGAMPPDEVIRFLSRH